MRNLLVGLETRISDGKNPTVDELFSLLETFAMFEEHYTEERLEQLKQRRETLGGKGMQKDQHAWQDLIAAVKAAAEDGTPPEGKKGRELA